MTFDVFQLTRQLSPDILSFNDGVSRPSVRVFGVDGWSTGVHEWEIRSIVSHPTVSAELYAPKKLH